MIQDAKSDGLPTLRIYSAVSRKGVAQSIPERPRSRPVTSSSVDTSEWFNDRPTQPSAAPQEPSVDLLSLFSFQSGDVIYHLLRQLVKQLAAIKFQFLAHPSGPECVYSVLVCVSLVFLRCGHPRSQGVLVTDQWVLPLAMVMVEDRYDR